AWIGYQHLLDDHMAAAGFERRFPDGRILHLCARAPDVTISQIGRELGITRQGASKNVERLRARGFVALRPSPTDGREKVVSLTPHAAGYLDAQRRAARTIERRLRLAVGDAPFEALAVLLDALGEHGETRMREYLRERLTGQS
ncbi:MAG TPA: MarR family transcriptional regulator, partial [Acidimicrobiales bacterium]|nr:MarR family transcriptional regulator [Acidimicrobiales bacterium]